MTWSDDIILDECLTYQLYLQKTSGDDVKNLPTRGESVLIG
jgi:hypothetical protein